MDWLRQWFEYPAEPLLLAGSYDANLVLLSFVIAVFSSAIAIQITAQAVSVEKKSLRIIMLSSGSIALGGGVWSMHFIGMLAFSLCTPISYQPGLTLLSMLPSVAASWVALDLISKRQLRRRQLLEGGVLVGAGIGTMHYMGMAAMQMSVALRYDLIMFLLSILVAIALAVLALWVRFGLKRFNLSTHWLTLLSALVMGTAISGMHYTGMAAARFVPPPGFNADADNSELSWLLALGVAFITLVIAGLVVAVNLLLKHRELSAKATASEARLLAMMDTAVDGIVTINTRGLIQSMNKAAEKIFGWTEAELLQQNVNILTPAAIRSEHDSYLDNYLRTGNAKIIGVGRDVEAVHKDGHTLPVRLAIGHARLEDGDMFVAFITDISSRLQMERELRQAKNKAEQAAEARSVFVANMSHEIRTPMNAIIGFSDLLLDAELPSSQKNHLLTIHSAAHSLLHLLNDILDSAKLEKGKLQLEHSDFSLPALLDTVVSTLWLQARKKQLQLQLELDPQLAEFYYGAPDRLRQVLTNLLGNAIKFTEQGQVRLRVTAASEQQLTFSVEDTGIGIAADRLPFIFDAFTQADASMSRRFGGTGLGTTISKQLVELMGGQISVQSTEGVGSCFSFTLPLPPGKAIASAAGGYVPALPPLQLLIADDIPQNLELLKLLLQRAGHRVVAVTDGAEALQAVQQQQFDLVLMDIQMPNMDGLQACQHIRAWEAENNRPALPVIALTASVLDEDKVAAKDAGMQGFASKPIDFASLCCEIARVLQLDIRPAMAPQAVPTDTEQQLNLAKALQLWGSVATYLPQLQQFLLQQWPVLQHANTILQQGDYTAVQQLAHAIKGASANLGLETLSRLSGELEQAARQQQLARAQALLQVILQSWPEYQRLCHTLPAEQATAPSSQQLALDTAELSSLLSALQSVLLRHELDDSLIVQLSQYCGEHQALIAALLDAVNDFDFNLALQRLAQLQHKLNPGLD